MKKLVVTLIIFCSLTTMSYAQQQSGSLRHVVLFSFKSSSSAAEVKTIEDAFRKLPSQIKEIKDFNQGF